MVLKFFLYFSFNLNISILPYFSFFATCSLSYEKSLSKLLSFKVSVSISCLLDLSFIFLAVSSCLNFSLSLSYYYFDMILSLFSLAFKSAGFWILFGSALLICSLRLFMFFSNCSSFLLHSCNFFLRWTIYSFCCIILWVSSSYFL